VKKKRKPPRKRAETREDLNLAAIRLEGVRSGRILPEPDNAKEIGASPIVDDVRQVGRCTLYLGDCTKITPLLRDLDACCCDPPYELGIMGKDWDSSGVAAAWETWGGVRIALKPGAHLIAFAGSRTYHRIAMAIDLAGFEVRDQFAHFLADAPRMQEFLATLDASQRETFLRLMEERGFGGMLEWIYGSGFPKNHNIGAATQGDAGTRWEGWGTALKPAHEPVCLARAPLSEATVAANVMRWSTGAVNVGGTLVGTDGGTRAVGKQKSKADPYFSGLKSIEHESSGAGRWPSNVMHDGSREVLEAFPASARDATRFYYSAKAGRDEREFGLEEPTPDRHAGTLGAMTARANIHPTVKPIDLMRWLCRLVTPPGGTVLDPFMGSGTTGIAAVREGFAFVGCEQSPKYFDIARRRIQAAVDFVAREPDLVREISKVVKKKREEQGELL
jgi:site-specific DNA-methyltransferase (adenine-specific)